MLERTYNDYVLSPCVYPYTELPDIRRERTIRKVKLPREYTGIDFSRDYCSQLYPSSKWESENQSRFSGDKPDEARRKPDFVITSLDTRKHNPQSKQIFHIKRINKKPVCTVQTWETPVTSQSQETLSTIYKTSFQDRDKEPRRLVHRVNKPTEGIVPVNETGKSFDVRTEMMLPVCDSTVIPSAHNPHRYLLRKRKVPPPYRTSGIVYPALEKPRMTSYTPGMMQTGDLPFPNESLPVAQSDSASDRTSVSSLSGMEFSRRKYIQPPMGHILGKNDKPRPQSPVCVSSLAGKTFSRRRYLPNPSSEISNDFTGCVPETKSHRFDDKYLPFMRAKTII